MQAWEKAQTSARSGDARTLACLAFGAGLSAGEIVSVRPSDVEVDGDEGGREAVFVNVGGTRSRTVR